MISASVEIPCVDGEVGKVFTPQMMRKSAFFFVGLFLLAFSNIAAAPQDRSVTFTGEATEGKDFRQSIGDGLDFVLRSNSKGVTGWTLEVSPQGTPPDSDCGDFLWVATPPYDFENQSYLDTGYGITAQEAVRNSPREFNFVLNCADYETESKRVELVLYGSNASKKDVDEAQAKLGSSPLGKGKLWIEDSKISPGHGTGAGKDLGAIHWIKFKVEIKFPSVPPNQPPH